MQEETQLSNEPGVEIPDLETLRFVGLLLKGYDPFSFGRKKHKRIKALNSGRKRKRGKNDRARAAKPS